MHVFAGFPEREPWASLMNALNVKASFGMTETIFPLSRPVSSVRNNPYIKTPICWACKTLFSSVRSQKDIIIWMLTGKFEGTFPKDYFIKRFKNKKDHMCSGSLRMRRSNEECIIAMKAYNKQAIKKEIEKKAKKHTSKCKVKLSNNKRIKLIKPTVRQRASLGEEQIQRQFQVEVATGEELSLWKKRQYCVGT